MKKGAAFCSLIGGLIFLVTAGGVVLLLLAYAQWKAQAPEPVIVEEDTIVEEGGYTVDEVLVRFEDEVSAFETMTTVTGEEGQFVYRVTKGETTFYLVWGRGAITAPEGVTEISTGALEPGLPRAWAFVDSSEPLFLGNEPFLLR